MNSHRFLATLIFALIFPNLSANHDSSNPAIFIVHGTIASNRPWYQPGGDFFEAIVKGSAHFNAKVIPFKWEGAADSKSRLRGATELAKLLLKQTGTVYTIGHSHGGNVVNLASTLIKFAQSRPSEKEITTVAQEMLRLSRKENKLAEWLHFVKRSFLKTATWCDSATSNHASVAKLHAFLNTQLKKFKELTNGAVEIYSKEDTLLSYVQAINNAIAEIEPLAINQKTFAIEQNFSLATPINEICYAPNPAIIKHTYHLYSIGDCIQRVRVWPFAPLYKERAYHAAAHITNICTTIKSSRNAKTENANPGHDKLHASCIGNVLFKLQSMVPTASHYLMMEFFSNNEAPVVIVPSQKLQTVTA